MIGQDETFSAYICADCDPRLADEGDEKYERAYIILVPAGQPCPFDICPQCDSYGGFCDWGTYTTLRVPFQQTAAS